MNPETETKAIERGGYSPNALHERGWTDAMIAEVLGWPDHEVENPYYSGSNMMRLYAIERVRRAEVKEAFAALQAKRKRPRKEVTP